MKISFLHILFQSFSSIGPFLDFIALFPVMALFGGTELPEITVVAFLISFTTLIPVLFFSGLTHTNEGYASYAYMGLGRRAGIATGFVYILYSVLVLPNIIMFLSSFLFPFTGIAKNYEIFFYILFPVIYLILIFIPLSRGLAWSIKPIVILGMIEIGSIIAISLFMLATGKGSLRPQLSILSGNFWDGVIIGILMFSGGGSGIFLKKDAEETIGEIKIPLIYSYVFTGFALILGSFAVTRFLGNNMVDFGSDPLILFQYLGQYGGSAIIIFFIALLIISGFNLTLSYGNALIQMMEDFSTRMVNFKIERNNILYFMILISLILLVAGHFSYGYYGTFLFLASLISILYITVHIITGISFTRTDLSWKIKAAGLLSSMILIISLISSIYGYISDNPGIIIAYIIALIMIPSFTLFLENRRHEI